ncbi:hypothetical protein KFE25_007831 [Diacronema lutheri]|uniref:Uncharacterized protein n=1 Tax=Diacronema lutheri TaxID=2081491 RepID=A0A8J6CIX4_DIALT|nr:hypothetical protein KFE25_007831 [Diacronema lutheri]
MARMLAAQASFAYCPALQPGADVRGMVNPHTAALEQAANTASARIIAAALVTVTALLCALFVFCYDDGDHMPPRAPVSVAEAVRAMASDGAPRFLYELSCRVGPVFRLPLPTTRRFYVVADADVAAAVLAHPLSTTPSLACAEALMLTTDALSIRSTHDAPCEATAWPHLDDARVAAICRTHACGLVHNVIAPAALSGAPVDVCALALRVGLGIICEACLGYVPAAAECAELSHAVLLAAAQARCAGAPWLVRALLSPPSVCARAAERSMRFGHTVLANYRQAEAAARAELHALPIAHFAHGGTYAHEGARATALVAFVAAAHSAVASRLAWALHDLAQHAREQTTVRLALRGVAEPTAVRELADAIHESMRLHCANQHGCLRLTGCDFACPARTAGATGAGAHPRGATRRIPAHSIVLLHAPSILRDAVHFERPNDFLPARWSGASAPSPALLGGRECSAHCDQHWHCPPLARAALVAALAATLTEYELRVCCPPSSTLCSTRPPVGLALRVCRAPS